jgi:hypothetical protein
MTDNDVRSGLPSRIRPILCACLAATGAGAAEPAPLGAAQLRADQQFASYAYAHEFGSGIYDFGGHTLQVYTLPFAWTAREAAADRVGVRLKLPLTLGFLDFRTADVVSTGLPDDVDSMSFVPGVELRVEVGRHWVLLPYVQAGASLADTTDVETRLFGAGLRVQRSFDADAYSGLYSVETIYSRVHYRGDLPNDDFVRVRNGLQWTRDTGRAIAGHALQLALFSVVDVYADPPTGPATGVELPEMQLEAGVVFGTEPGFRFLGLPLPRLGLSYRFAGDLSSLRFVIGAPF